LFSLRNAQLSSVKGFVTDDNRKLDANLFAPRERACGSQEALANAYCEPAAASTDSFLT
jgi:hypothetical protein